MTTHHPIRHDLTVFCILLFAALLHASWNAIVKAGTDKLYSAISVSGSATLIALVLPFSPQPSAASWPGVAITQRSDSLELMVVLSVFVVKQRWETTTHRFLLMELRWE